MRFSTWSGVAVLGLLAWGLCAPAAMAQGSRVRAKKAPARKVAPKRSRARTRVPAARKANPKRSGPDLMVRRLTGPHYWYRDGRGNKHNYSCDTGKALFRLTVEVRNVGNKPATLNGNRALVHLVSVKHPSWVGKARLNYPRNPLTIPPGGRVEAFLIMKGHPSSPGIMRDGKKHSFSLTVDPENRSPEANERNNTQRLQIRMPPTCIG